MTAAGASLIWALAGGYLAIGFVFALAFVTLGAAAIDPAARGMSPQARAIVLPGCALLWPLMLAKWLTRQGPPES